MVTEEWLTASTGGMAVGGATLNPPGGPGGKLVYSTVQYFVGIEPPQRLRRAVHNNDATLVKRIIDNHPDLIHNPDHSAAGLSNSNLHLAASLGHLQVCKVLVALGHEKPTSALNDNHQTALMLAAGAGHTEVVHFLAENDPATILRRDSRGRDAIMEASVGGHDTVLQILLTYVPGGAEPAVKNADIDGNTALHFASSNGHLLVLRTLLAAGADAEKRNVWSWSAVAYSATVQAEVYFKNLVAEVEKRKRVKQEAEEVRKGGSSYSHPSPFSLLRRNTNFTGQSVYPQASRAPAELLGGYKLPSVDFQGSQSNPREFPYPATKLITGQHIWVHPTGHSWVCLVIGSFYDAKGHEIWRIQLLLGYRGGQYSNPDPESGTEPRILATGTRGSGNLSSAYRNLDFAIDSYSNITTATHLDIDSSPFTRQVGPRPFTQHSGSTLRAGSRLPTNTPAFMATQVPGHGGWNPRFGWDADGGPPPSGPGYAAAVPGMAYGGGFGAPVVNEGAYGQYPLAGMSQPQPQAYPFPQQGYYGTNGYYPDQRPPQPHPHVSLDVPGMNMVNSTGGAGCEPGYNYIFHDEHTKIHVFKSAEPPWRAPNMNYSFAKFQVPTNTTIAELMFRFGAFNPDPAKNVITEVIEGGNGRWYRGMIFRGDEENDIKKTLKQCGWDRSRSGREKAVVWLWITKD
ncbi:hypothetical protein NUW58_g2696 [Xylaria curta]|uniref:Uncharacterized protein n=1 Tax=Xylaria curta TaxID=42375 RepID=A0ACC1PFH5_9PEZI|nr:hypothetical protein NUW58_g2696 [Xylaria curta]